MRALMCTQCSGCSHTPSRSVIHRTDDCVRTAMLVLLACQALHSAMAHAFERRARGAVEGRGGGRAAEAEAKEPGLSGGGGSGGARRARRFA